MSPERAGIKLSHRKNYRLLESMSPLRGQRCGPSTAPLPMVGSGARLHNDEGP